LALRVNAGSRSAEAVAAFLAAQSGVTRVWYPTRADHPQRNLAMKQMAAGGTVVTLEVAGGRAGAFRVMNGFHLIEVSNNLGDSKSLATHPATTTYMRIGEAERAKLGISDGVIRLSVGLEDTEDLRDDLARALGAANRVLAA
jgi:O-succinylhomoserine sulfhydrylase